MSTGEILEKFGKGTMKTKEIAEVIANEAGGLRLAICGEEMVCGPADVRDFLEKRAASVNAAHEEWMAERVADLEAMYQAQVGLLEETIAKLKTASDTIEELRECAAQRQSVEAQPAAPQSATFRSFQQMNKTRCEAVFPPAESWTPIEWALAIAGEVGDVCSLLKKVRRGDFTLETVKPEILNEIADVMTYCDLLITKLGADTGEVILSKFNEVSNCMGYLAATQNTEPSNEQEPELEKQPYDLRPPKQSLEPPQSISSGLSKQFLETSALQSA